MTAPNGSYPEIDALPARLRQQVKDDHARGCQGREYGCDCGYDLSTEGLLEMAADEIDRLRDTVDIPPERHRTDEQRKDIQRAWDIVGMVTDGHPLNSTEGHLAVLRGIQMGRQLSGVAQEAQQPPQQAIDFNGSYPDTAQALWEALCEQCAATKDKSQVKALVMVRREDVAAVFSGAQQAVDCGEMVRVAKMAKAAAEMELGLAASPDFSPRDMLDAANAALSMVPSTERS